MLSTAVSIDTVGDHSANNLWIGVEYFAAVLYILVAGAQRVTRAHRPADREQQWRAPMIPHWLYKSLVNTNIFNVDKTHCRLIESDVDVISNLAVAQVVC